MNKCVKCSTDISVGAKICSSCNWPFSLEALRQSAFRIRRITLDTGCINATGKNQALNTLERWSDKGYFELQRSDAMLAELKGNTRVQKAVSLDKHPRLFNLDASNLDNSDVLAGPDLGSELQNILFPTAQPLTVNQWNDVEHLRLHVRTGGDAFVTLNRNDFITQGRQEAFRARGIWVFEPSELVKLLKDLFQWSCAV